MTLKDGVSELLYSETVKSSLRGLGVTHESDSERFSSRADGPRLDDPVDFLRKATGKRGNATKLDSEKLKSKIAHSFRSLCFGTGSLDFQLSQLLSTL